MGKKIFLLLIALLWSVSCFADYYQFGKARLPVDYREVKICGTAEVTQSQALRYLQQKAGQVRLSCGLKDLVELYYAEGTAEGIRPDLALCQAILETGFFAYGGSVKPEQNNYCGLGTTGKGVEGARFASAAEGVRAHIQHLLAYCREREPKSRIVDPRYKLAHSIRLERGLVDTWYGLNGKWAVDPVYCEKIMVHYENMKKL